MIAGDFIPEGTSVGVHQLATFRFEENFKFAKEFRPERWLPGENGEFENDRKDAFEPFSVGARNCK